MFFILRYLEESADNPTTASWDSEQSQRKKQKGKYNNVTTIYRAETAVNPFEYESPKSTQPSIQAEEEKTGARTIVMPYDDYINRKLSSYHKKNQEQNRSFGSGTIPIIQRMKAAKEKANKEGWKEPPEETPKDKKKKIPKPLIVVKVGSELEDHSDVHTEVFLSESGNKMCTKKHKLDDVRKTNSNMKVNVTAMHLKTGHGDTSDSPINIKCKDCQDIKDSLETYVNDIMRCLNQKKPMVDKSVITVRSSYRLESKLSREKSLQIFKENFLRFTEQLHQKENRRKSKEKEISKKNSKKQEIVDVTKKIIKQMEEYQDLITGVESNRFDSMQKCIRMVNCSTSYSKVNINSRIRPYFDSSSLFNPSKPPSNFTANCKHRQYHTCFPEIVSQQSFRAKCDRSYPFENMSSNDFDCLGINCPFCKHVAR